MDAERPADEAPNVGRVFGRAYDETIELLIEARDYLAQNHELAQGRGSLAYRLVYAHETTRLTTRLSQVMTRVLVHRAIHAGEISAEEAGSDAHRLGAREICLAEDDKAVAMLPPFLQSLSKRSGEFYRRVERLDTLAAQPGPSGPSFDFL